MRRARFSPQHGAGRPRQLWLAGYASLLAVAFVASVSPLRAQSTPEPLPSFDTCLNNEMARYERALQRVQAIQDGPLFPIGDVRGVDYCGSVGIVRCDRSPAPVSCQLTLADAQTEQTQEVLAALPKPDTIIGDADDWPQSLYPVLHALAHGRSAGPDCRGTTDVMHAWCMAREANRGLATAVLAWQLARYLGVATDAVEAGWADAPRPVSPRMRPKWNKG